MKQIHRNSVLGALLILALGASTVRAADDLASKANEAIATFQRTDSTLKKMMDESVGYAIFPSIGKAGFIIGGERGKGLVYQGGKLVGEARVTEVSIGATAGAESYSELILFESTSAIRDFKASDWEMSAKVSAVAAAEGAAKNAKYRQGVAVFTLTKGGLMVQASVGGQKFKFKPTE